MRGLEPRIHPLRKKGIPVSIDDRTSPAMTASVDLGAVLRIFAPTHPQPRNIVMQITWFGHSAFRLDFAGKAVLIDPFFTGNPAFVSDKAAAIRGVTHILLTHGHGDHVGDALDIS